MFLADKLNKGGSLGGYQISRSLRFNSADTTYLNRTPASAGNRRTWTWSGWVKRSTLNASGSQSLFDVQLDAPNFFTFYIRNDTVAYDMCHTTSGNRIVVGTTAVYRDVSAWYHFVLAVDTTNATAANRIRAYVNGSEVILNQYALGSGYVAQNADLAINSTSIHSMGRRNDSGGDLYLPAYMTEVNFIDGQALTPSSFGETNAQTGVWQPKAYSGSYGTNGFYLNFSDNSNTTAATLGKDYSGNGNNWTPNNFSVTAGSGNDSLVDSPTSYGTDTGVGGTVRGNYCTLNPLFNATTLTNGNLDASLNAISTTGTFGANSGKWYFECTFTSLTGTSYLGIADQTLVKSDSSFSYSQVYVYLSNSQKGGNGGSATYGSSYTTGDVIGVAYDLDSGSITFYKNGTSQGVAYSTGFTSGYFWRPFLYCSATTTATFNFGQRPFAYTAPSGFKALCTQNLPTPTIGATTATQAGKYFNTIIWTGDSANPRTFTGVGFQPDLVWAKGRSIATSHFLSDAVRGVTSSDTRTLATNNTTAETNQYSPNGGVTAFTSDGFTTSGSTNLNLNFSGQTFVAWNWKANGSGSTNTSGSITSTVSANTTSGFSVVTYTGNGTSGATVGHGLGVAPKMIIVKNRSTGGYNWPVYHSSLSANNILLLNTTDAQFAFSAFTSTPSSSVFTVGSWGGLNASPDTYVAYCFAEVAGYSKFGSYTGNGSTDGAFVYTGFRPAYVMIKRTDDVGEWVIKDTTRSPYNADGNTLLANRSDAEYGSGNTAIDELSNGFKCRTTSASANASGGTYIYMAFASNPFKYSLAR